MLLVRQSLRNWPRLRHMPCSKAMASQSQARAEAPRRGPAPRSRPSEPPQCRRRWKKLTRESPRAFTLMSYNTLADSLLFQNRYLYYHAPPYCLSWNYRKFRLINEVRRYQTDLACLQEVDQYDFFARELGKHGYAGHFLGRTGDKPDGLAIFYRTEQFSVLALHEVRFKLSDDKKAVMNRDNVALVCVLSHTPTGRRLCVANTHLLYNHRRGDIKLGQLCMLLAEIHSVRDEHGCDGVVLCGDFNILPQSPLWSLIKTGNLDLGGLHRDMLSGQARFEAPQLYEQWLAGSLDAPHLILDPRAFPPPELAHLSLNCTYRDPEVELEIEVEVDTEGRQVQHGLQLHSVYDESSDAITTWHRNSTKATVDYIWVNRGLRAVSRLELMTLANVEELGGLPNPWNVSDHQPLVAKLAFA